MSDYKELLLLSKKAADAWKNDSAYYQAGALIDSLCEAVETVIAERDAAMGELRGICWCCKNGEKWANARIGSKLITCEYIRENVGIAFSGRMEKCPHWEWRGIGGSDGKA